MSVSSNLYWDGFLMWGKFTELKVQKVPTVSMTWKLCDRLTWSVSRRLLREIMFPPPSFPHGPPLGSCFQPVKTDLSVFTSAKPQGHSPPLCCRSAPLNASDTVCDYCEQNILFWYRIDLLHRYFSQVTGYSHQTTNLSRKHSRSLSAISVWALWTLFANALSWKEIWGQTSLSSVINMMHTQRSPLSWDPSQ